MLKSLKKLGLVLGATLTLSLYSANAQEGSRKIESTFKELGVINMDTDKEESFVIDSYLSIDFENKVVGIGIYNFESKEPVIMVGSLKRAEIYETFITVLGMATDGSEFVVTYEFVNKYAVYADHGNIAFIFTDNYKSLRNTIPENPVLLFEQNY